jgi:hypothetical protein
MLPFDNSAGAKGAVDTSTSMGKLVLGILGVFAEFELDIRKERRREGIEKTKASNPERYQGRRPTVDKDAIRALSAQGIGSSAIAKPSGQMPCFVCFHPAFFRLRLRSMVSSAVLHGGGRRWSRRKNGR